MKKKKKTIVLHSPIQVEMNARRTGGGLHQDKRLSEKTKQKEKNFLKDWTQVIRNMRFNKDYE
jgi:hypothetical protein